MLTRLLKEIESSGGTATVSELARRLGVDPGVVSAMAGVLEARGALTFSDSGSLCAFPKCGGCCRSCPLNESFFSEKEHAD